MIRKKREAFERVSQNWSEDMKEENRRVNYVVRRKQKKIKNGKRGYKIISGK